MTGTAQPTRRAELRELVRNLRARQFGDERTRLYANYGLLDQFKRHVAPEYQLTDVAKAWWRDEEFFTAHRRFEGDNNRPAERRYFLKELVKLVSHLKGDTAEAGVYRGVSSWFICQARGDESSTHWAFDSFVGLSDPSSRDGTYWRRGDLSVGPEEARRVLAPFDARILQGWIPDVFGQADIKALVFAHIDVDLHDPSLAAMEFFYPRLVSGGIIVCDDYGQTTCPGAKRAVDSFMATRPEPVVHSPTSQGLIIKR
jgi:O-methyltransferase